MKFKFHVIFSLLFILGSVHSFAQIGIGTKTPAPSAALEVTSSTNNKGILIPRITATQKDAIVSPAEGLLVYQTTAPIGFYYFTNTVWKLIVDQTELDKKLATAKTYVDDKIAAATIADADATTKGKIQLAGDLGGTAAAPTVPALALKANTSDVTTGLASKANTSDLATVATSGSYNDLVNKPSAYVMPKASVSELGGVKIGANLSIDANGVLSAAASGNSASTLTGVVPVANGGTGATTVAGIKSLLGFSSPSVAIGDQAGKTNQGGYTVGVGGGAGATNQGSSSVAVGYVAGYQNQGVNSIAIGGNAAQGNQGTQSVAIGFAAGQNGQGANSVAIGTFAGQSGQAANSIAINATGTSTPLNPTTTGFFVDPIINRTATSTALYYNTTTKEITSGTAASGSTNLSSGFTGSLPVANGGTGQTTLAGVKNTLGLTSSKISIGSDAGLTNQGNDAIALGYNAGLTNQGASSIAIGYLAGGTATQGGSSIAIGPISGGGGNQSVAIGLAAWTGANNATAVGTLAAAGHVNSSALGYQAVTNSPNTIQLGADGVTVQGSTAITNVRTSGSLTAGAVTYPNTNGTAGQVLTANNNGNASWTTVASVADASTMTGTVAVANGGTGATTATAALTSLGAAPIASPTFTGSVTAPIYASTPQALTAGSTINWNPANGLNASVTLNQNSTLNFTSNPTAGSYGTLIVTQDATGSRTITLPSTANKVLGSTSTTTITLSTAANAKDILNFYYDGTNCYWNIGQGYGSAATASSTNLASGVTGSLPVANGGTGATTLTGLIKGNGTSAMTAATAGTDYLAPTGSAAGLTNFPTLNQNTTGNAATATLATSATSATNATTAGNITATSNTTLTSLANLTTVGTITSGTWSGTAIAVANGGTGATTLTANNVLLGNGSSALQAVAPGASGNVLTSDGTTWTSSAPSGGSSSGGHYVGEVYGGGIVFYVTAGGYHGLIVDTYVYENTPEYMYSDVKNPLKHNTDKSGNLYTDWYIPSYQELTLLYNARINSTIATLTNINDNVFMSSDYMKWTQASPYRCLNFSNGSVQWINGDWTRKIIAIRSF